MGVVLGLLVAVPVAGIAFAAGRFIPRGETVSAGTVDPPAKKTPGDEFLSAVRELNGKAADADRRGDDDASSKLAGLLAAADCKNLSGVLQRQLETRNSLEAQRRELEKNAGKGQAIAERRLKLARLLLEVHALLVEVATGPKGPSVPDSKVLMERNGELEALALRLNGTDEDLNDVEQRANTRKLEFETLKRAARSGPPEGEAKEPKELAEAKKKIKEYHEHKNAGKKQEAEKSRLKALELLGEVINAGPDKRIDPKFVREAEMMKKALEKPPGAEEDRP
jgi:hypothetical protein